MAPFRRLIPPAALLASTIFLTLPETGGAQLTTSAVTEYERVYDESEALPPLDDPASPETTVEQRYHSIVPEEAPTAPAEDEADPQVAAELDRFRGASERRRHAIVWRPAQDEEEALARIEAHRPQAHEADPNGALPIDTRRRLASAWARARERVADYEGARIAYRKAIALGAETLANWRGLGRSSARTGEPEAAEAAFLAAVRLAEDGPGTHPREHAGAQRELGELYLSLGFDAAAVSALDRAIELDPAAPRTQQLWTLAVSRAGGVETPAELDAQLPLWPPTRAERVRDRIGRGLDAALAHAPEHMRRRIQRSVGAQTALLLGAVCAVLAIFWLALRVVRKSGDIAVEIHFPDELEGDFSVHLATTQGRHRRHGGADADAPARRKSTRTSHYAVSRETHFLRMPARRYWVTVQGALKEHNGKQALSEPWDEQSVDVAGNETARVVFDVSPRECPVDVTVRWDQRDPGEIGVAARGLPQSLRYSQGGQVRMRLPMGSHVVMVGSGDRVAEAEVEVQSFQPTLLEINLAGSEHLVFKGCPPAVDPYLHGDLSGAARALERDGHTNVANLLLARLHQEQGQTERAAERLESAGHNLEAARLRESIADFGRAAALFENAGEVVQAAQTYRAAGDLMKAGELYQSVDQLEEASACFEEAGATDALVGVLELRGRYLDAAHVARDAGDRARAVRLLQQVGRTDADYENACFELVEAFEHEGHADLAANKLEELMSVCASSATPDLQSHLAELHARADAPARALEVLEALREKEPTYPGIASRIESLRKLVSARRLDTGGDTAQTTATFNSVQRYEIIEEIGRGGMGVIFKARDRRLNRVIALKRMPENLREHPKAVQLFLNEAQAAARLNHPNIVTVYDTDQEDGNFYITMELLHGQPLNAILKQRGRLGPRDTARIGGQVARGLHYAHEMQVVHRDIKTANLFLTQEKVVKIMDFGLAKMMEEVRRGSTVIGGTPSYMAPEQAAGERVDHRADLYALGITLFELAVGRVPFDKGDVAYHHRHTPPPDPRSVAAGIPDVLAELILQLIQKDPAARCQSAAEVEQRLERLLVG